MCLCCVVVWGLMGLMVRRAFDAHKLDNCALRHMLAWCVCDCAVAAADLRMHHQKGLNPRGERVRTSPGTMALWRRILCVRAYEMCEHARTDGGFSR